MRKLFFGGSLSGHHSYCTREGKKVHVWMRDGRYIARGRIDGVTFGEQLGRDEQEATANLRQLLCDIENGTYVRPSESKRSPLGKGRVPRASLRDILEAYLREKRSVRGSSTASTYRARLSPVLNFAELPQSLKRWPLAKHLDRTFAVELKTYLHQYQNTRNGRTGAKPKHMPATQIYNVLDCLRSALNWASRADVRKLPADWTNPLTPDLVDERPSKDPFRPDPVPLSKRIEIVSMMDW